MVTLVDFVAELLGSLLRLFVVATTEVALRDPIAFLIALAGGLLIAFSVGFSGYLTLGALLDLVTTDGDSTFAQPPEDRV